MSGEKFDTDMAVPSNMDAVNKYYSNNLTKIIRKDSLSSSSETIASIDLEEEVCKLKTSKLTSNDSYDSTINPHFKSITVTESSDVHFGNKIFNCPVTIKQNIFMREDNSLDRNASINFGFEGIIKILLKKF